MEVGEELSIDIEAGKTLMIKLLSISDSVDEAGMRDVLFRLNGVPRVIKVLDKDNAKSKNIKTAEKADPSVAGQVGASMPGTVAGIKVKLGQVVRAGEPLAVLSAMKMETVVASPIDGEVTKIPISIGDLVANEDLLMVVSPA
mmetsp:Transcript_26901/g.67477  ORF Transcript_26901/g.67477 Transcript_26901/m.67477 type:complete len:143 (+) Transcript_26901:380-808(+)